MKAGHFAQKMAVERTLKACGLTLLSALCGFTALSRGPGRLLALDPLAVVATALAVVGGLSAKSMWRSVSRAERGAGSERRVATILERLKLGTVLHNVDLSSGGDADHVIVYDALVVVETKTGRGEVRYTPGALYAGSHRVPGDPVRQANRQAAAVRRLTGVWTTAVVCVPDMTNAPFRHDETIICSALSLPGVLKSLPRRLDEDTKARVEAALRPLSVRT